MIRLIALVAICIALAGCSSEAPAPATPVATAFTDAPTTSTLLPAPLRGVWTADPAGRCTPGTELRIEVRANRIRFHESVARITGVTQLDPHSWSVDATVTGEGETRERSFDLNLNEDGTLTRVEAPIPDITYTRCESET